MRLPVKLAATVLGLGMLSAGALGAGAQSTSLLTTGVHAASAVVHHAPTRSAQAVPAQDAACAADQASGGAESSGTELKGENATSDTVADTDNLQCGDQVQDTGTNGSATQHSPVTSANVDGSVRFLQASRSQASATTQTETGEQNSVTEKEASSSTETDGIVCEQQGQNEGNNAGC